MYRDLNPRPLYKCQGHLLQSEVLPILSSSSSKDESNAVFPRLDRATGLDYRANFVKLYRTCQWPLPRAIS